MRVGDIERIDLEQELAGGLTIKTGPFWFRLRSRIPHIINHIELLYPDATVDPFRPFVDFPIGVAPKRGLRSLIKPLAEFWFNGHIPFTPLSLDQSPALAEWGMNWCISAYAHQYLMVHAAVIEKNGCGVIMPAPSGSGKSTLCAALVSRGWRLLSDEHALITTDGQAMLTPNPKPLSLKNASISIIRDYWPDAVFGDICHDTQKGDVVHVRPPRDSVLRSDELARPAYIVFPQYHPGAALTVEQRDPAEAWLALAENAFNYHILGEHGFNALATIMKQAQAFDLRYSSLDEAVQQFEAWVS